MYIYKKETNFLSFVVVTQKMHLLHLLRIWNRWQEIHFLEPSSPCIQSFWTYSSRCAAVTSTFGAIKEALPIIFLFSKIRQTWGHSPSWVGRSLLGMKMPLIRSPFSLCSPHLIIGQCDSLDTPLGMGVGKVSLVKSNSWYEFKLILS